MSQLDAVKRTNEKIIKEFNHCPTFLFSIYGSLDYLHDTSAEHQDRIGYPRQQLVSEGFRTIKLFMVIIFTSYLLPLGSDKNES